MKRRNIRRGFTLIELLVVMAIIGIMSSVVMVSLNGARLRGRDIRRTIDIRELISVLALWYDDHNQSFPCTSGFVNSDGPNWMQFLVDGGYLSENPRDPINNGSYHYEFGTFKKSPTGPCGQIVFFGTYTETGAICPTGGVLDGAQHCHIFFPEPLPCPNNPYDTGFDSCPSTLKD